MSEATTSTLSATGRRKTAVARVRMDAGSGAITVNDRPFEEYFGTVTQQNAVLAPLQVAESLKKWDIFVTAHGGGLNGQVGAIQLGVARALIKDNPELRPALKAAGFLRRDPRMKERKKAGQPGARKKFQFSKR